MEGARQVSHGWCLITFYNIWAFYVIWICYAVLINLICTTNVSQCQGDQNCMERGLEPHKLVKTNCISVSAIRNSYFVALWGGCLFFFAGTALLCCCLTTWATPTFKGWVVARVTWLVNNDGCCMIVLYWFPCEWAFLKETGAQCGKWQAAL